MNKVWVTRTLPAAKGTADRLRKCGFDPVISPLLKVSPPKLIPAVPDDNELLIFTSKNGVRAFCDYVGKRHWPVITVGDATAHLAQEKGFDYVLSASGTALDVLDLIKSTVKPERSIFHCGGETISVDIAENLCKSGYNAKRHIYYRTERTGDLPENIKSLNYVLLHSPMAAKILNDLELDLSHIIAVSISEAANAQLQNLLLGEKRIANAPTEAALLACLHI